MSHFATIKTKLTNKQALVSGLKEALAKKGIFIEIEVLEQARRLVNKYDKDDESYGEIIISHKVLAMPHWQGMVDVGYLWNQATSQFELQFDSYDYNRNRLGSAFGHVENFNKAVQFEHDKIVLQETLSTNYPATEWDYGEQTVLEDGTITMEITKKPQLIGAWY